MLANDKIAQLFVNEGGKLVRHDFVCVTVADDKAVAVRNNGASNCVTIFDRDGRGRERAKVEENHDFGGGDELGEELDEDSWSHITNFVEEDSKT